MKNHTLLKTICIIISFVILLFSTSCNSIKIKEYYSDVNNYICVSGDITSFSYNEAKDAIYIGFTNLSVSLDDTCFKIVGNNVTVVQSKGFDQKIEIGNHIDFVTAPKYFGDGYVMPIVEFKVNDEVLLDFEEGYQNLIAWLS